MTGGRASRGRVGYDGEREQEMSVQAHRALVTGLVAECVNANRTDQLHRFIAEDVVIHPSTPRGTPDTVGLAQFIEVFHVVHAVFPDLHVDVEDLIVEGDRVAMRWLMQATHAEEWMGIPATGRTIVAGGIDIYRIIDGRIVEWWRNEDLFSLLEQLRG
jgi:steroid delta-isomerase-like uncharacterized protein